MNKKLQILDQHMQNDKSKSNPYKNNTSTDY